jgi:hypothetical protein
MDYSFLDPEFGLESGSKLDPRPASRLVELGTRRRRQTTAKKRESIWLAYGTGEIIAHFGVDVHIV